MLRFTSIREPTTFFSKPQLCKARFTYSSECHSKTFTFLGERLSEVRYICDFLSPTSTKDQMFQFVVVMTLDKRTTLSSDPDHSFKLPRCGGQFEVGLLGL